MIDTFRSTMHVLNEAFDDIKIHVTSIPIIWYFGYRMKKYKKSFTKLADIVNKFLNGYDTNEEYKQYVPSGTSGQENVRGRLEWWRNKSKTANNYIGDVFNKMSPITYIIYIILLF